MNHPLEDQGPFIAIVHKLTDFIVKAERGDEEAKAICEKFQVKYFGTDVTDTLKFLFAAKMAIFLLGVQTGWGDFVLCDNTVDQIVRIKVLCYS